jgi:lycopene beta-cyclase
MAEHTQYDLVILGGGCAGLSLASKLSEYDKKAPKVLLIEQRTNYTNDRTWCFWDIDDPEYQSLVSQSWSRFELANQPRIHHFDCSQHQYLMLESQHFYEAAIKEISANPQIQLMLGQEVLSASINTDKSWHIKTTHSELTAHQVIDTRPPKKIHHDDSVLWQSFVGYEIKTQADYFSPEKMVLMDFDPTFKNGLAFIYILPTNGKKALIEYTVFSENIIPKQQLITRLKKSIALRVDSEPYEILRVEHGTLPMGYQPAEQDKAPNYLYAGLFAGAARPSSGYAFQRIQSWSKKCAQSIVNEHTLYGSPKENRVQSFMDGLFLTVIKNNPTSAASLFEDLFNRCDLNTVIKFMSDKATVSDYFRIIKSLPPGPFIKALPGFIIEKTCHRLGWK